MRQFTIIAILLLSIFADTPTAAAHSYQHRFSVVKEVLTLEDKTRIQAEEFHGSSKWAVIQHLFTSSTVKVHCPGHKDFAVYTGKSFEDVRLAYNNGERAWCGWERFFGHAPETCVVPVSPFGDTVVAVAKPKSWFDAFSSLSSSSVAANNEENSSKTVCTMERVHELSMPRLLGAVLGAFLFSTAPQLAESMPFRLAGGGLGFAALSSIVVLFILYRSIPHRKSFLFGSALFGSTLAAAVRFILGTWLPSISQILQNPLVIGYTALSGLMGVALTYYYSDTNNRKINTMLRIALQLVGLGLLAGSASSWEGSIVALSSLAGWRLAPLIKQEKNVFKALVRAKEAVQHDLKESIPKMPATEGRLPPEAAAAAMPGTPNLITQMGANVVAAAATAVGAQPPSPLVERGLILNVETGKTIQIGKGTYNKLKDMGYEVNFVAGTLTPPSGGGGGGGSSGGSGRKTKSARSRRN